MPFNQGIAGLPNQSPDASLLSLLQGLQQNQPDQLSGPDLFATSGPQSLTLPAGLNNPAPLPNARAESQFPAPIQAGAQPGMADALLPFLANLLGRNN